MESGAATQVHWSRCCNCGNPYQARHHAQRYCMPRCRSEAEFTRRFGRAFCSRSRRAMGERTCLICGQPYVAIRTNQCYCSKRCRKAAPRLLGTWQVKAALDNNSQDCEGAWWDG